MLVWKDMARKSMPVCTQKYYVRARARSCAVVRTQKIVPKTRIVRVPDTHGTLGGLDIQSNPPPHAP